MLTRLVAVPGALRRARAIVPRRHLARNNNKVRAASLFLIVRTALRLYLKSDRSGRRLLLNRRSPRYLA